jgi:phosphatidylinositol-3-phosphatase
VRKAVIFGLSACLTLMAFGGLAIQTAKGAGSIAPVVVVMLENREATQLTASNAPYLTSLKSTGRYFSSYSAVVHPSFPNYLAFASGSTHGNTGGGAVAGAFPGDNLWNQLSQAGVSWGVYQEYMPAPCYDKTSNIVMTPTKDKYAINHNPATVFANVFNSAQCQHVLPLSQMPATLPAVSFVTPSYCNDMHGFQNDPSYPPDCQVGNSNALITRGDSWLQAHVEQWRAEGAIVIVTFDEGKSDFGVGGRVFTVEVGPGIQPSTDATPLNHYSLLAGIEDRFGLPRLNNAIAATPLFIDPMGGPPPDQTPPTQPGKPVGIGVDATSIRISWAASSDASMPITYRVYRDGVLNPVGQTTATVYVDAGLAPSSSHTYVVDAVDAANNVGAMSVSSDPVTLEPPPTSIFSDGFDSGNFSAWTNNTRMTIDLSQGGGASPSARMSTNAQSAFAYKDLPSALATVCLSANIRVTSPGTAALDLLRLRSPGNSPSAKVFRNASGKLAIRSDYAAVQKASIVSLPSGWHNVELCGAAGTGKPWDLYLDGVKVINGWVTDTDPVGISRVQIGDSAAKTATANFDDVFVDQTPG